MPSRRGTSRMTRSSQLYGVVSELMRPSEYLGLNQAAAVPDRPQSEVVLDRGCAPQAAQRTTASHAALTARVAEHVGDLGGVHACPSMGLRSVGTLTMVRRRSFRTRPSADAAASLARWRARDRIAGRGVSR